MVRKIALTCLLLSYLNADTYERLCITCHKNLSYTPQEIFMRYLLSYGGENNVKAGLFHYFLYPSRDISVMPKDFLDEYKIYNHSRIKEEDLKKSIDEYWELYKVKGRLK